MNVPLDNLYHWVDGLLPSPACVYVFRPHGSRKISNIDRFKKYNHNAIWEYPGIIMHDQEPLDWELCDEPTQYLDYFDKKIIDYFDNKITKSTDYSKLINKHCSQFNLNNIVLRLNTWAYDNPILVHSEKNGRDLEKYLQNGFICVHYWAHAVIARDWYRFAQFDSRLRRTNEPKNKFLIYCRDWSHRREYRLKFLEMLIHNGLDSISQTSVMQTNSENIHFSQHQFENSKFELVQPELISQIPTNLFPSFASADYEPGDFTNSEISVVLETVFDDSRIHLTEKTLRPIACGHPFILAAGPGALEYIRSYGFKTFAPWIDESYDLETDSFSRMGKIITSIPACPDWTITPAASSACHASSAAGCCQAGRGLFSHRRR